MIYFISGHRDVKKEEFEEYYVPKLREVLRDDPTAEFVVGDYWGVDEMAQEWLSHEGLAKRVTVYHMFSSPRVCADPCFATVGGFTGDEERDAAMTQVSDIDIAFVRPGKRMSGTAQNIVRRWEKLGVKRKE